MNKETTKKLTEKLKEAIDSGQWEPDIWKETPDITKEELQELFQKIVEGKGGGGRIKRVI